MDGIKVLRVINGMTQVELSSKLMIAQNTLCNWENGNREPDVDALARIAKLFGVSVDAILRTHYQEGQCPECGMHYCPEILQDIREHNAKHAQWLKAIKQFGFCWPYSIREDAKNIGYAGMSDKEFSCDERIEFCINLFKAWFSRSLEASCYSLSHVDFPTYTAMRLHQEETEKLLLPYDIGAAMIERFGQREGIPKDSNYLIPSGRKKQASSVKTEDALYAVSIVDPKGKTYSKQVTSEQAKAVMVLLE